ncbi:hypothetical protein GCM10009630_60240 [Kribbella jejuensis]
MTRRRNTRDRQLHRSAWPAFAENRCNGVWLKGYDEGHAGRAADRRCPVGLLPWCVEAYLARGPITPRMSTQTYGRLEWQFVQPRKRITA